jgi:hypothetical protein
MAVLQLDEFKTRQLATWETGDYSAFRRERPRAPRPLKCSGFVPAVPDVDDALAHFTEAFPEDSLRL